jgi:hypothetical protein
VAILHESSWAEAKRHAGHRAFADLDRDPERHSCCSRTNLVLPLVAVSGAECVEALVLDGFTVRTRSDAATVLERGGRVVVIPDVAMLAPEDIEALLNDAGIPYDSFLDLLSETPTDPVGVRPTSGVRRTPAGDGR